MRFSRQEYWSGLPFPPPNPEIEPLSLESPMLAGRFFTTSDTWVWSIDASRVLWSLAMGWWGQADGGPEYKSWIQEVVGVWTLGRLVCIWGKNKSLEKESSWVGGWWSGRQEARRVTRTFYLVVQNNMRPASVRRTGVKGPGLQLKHGIFLGNTKLSFMKEQWLLRRKGPGTEASRVRYTRREPMSLSPANPTPSCKNQVVTIWEEWTRVADLLFLSSDHMSGLSCWE